MKAWKRMLLIAVVGAFAAVSAACSGESAPVEGTGGDESRPVYVYTRITDGSGVDKSLVDYVDEKTPGASDEWFSQFPHVDPEGTREVRDCNSIVFIQEMGLTREEVEKINGQAQGLLFTTKELDAIFSGDEKQLNVVFASPLAILVDGYLYSPEWVATHTPEDYRTVGITRAMLEEKLPLWESTFSGERLEGLQASVNAFLEES